MCHTILVAMGIKQSACIGIPKGRKADVKTAPKIQRNGDKAAIKSLAGWKVLFNRYTYVADSVLQY